MKFASAVALATIFFCSPCLAAPNLTAKETIARFYDAYFKDENNVTLPRNDTVRPPFSAGFLSDIAQNEAVCKEAYTGRCGWDGLCGWDIDPNPYGPGEPGSTLVRIHEEDEQYHKSGYATERGNVNVTLIDKKTGEPFNITYLMVRENGAWVVDDILLVDIRSTRDADVKSVRREARFETRFVQKLLSCR